MDNARGQCTLLRTVILFRIRNKSCPVRLYFKCLRTSTLAGPNYALPLLWRRVRFARDYGQGRIPLEYDSLCDAPSFGRELSLSEWPASWAIAMSSTANVPDSPYLIVLLIPLDPYHISISLPQRTRDSTLSDPVCNPPLSCLHRVENTLAVDVR